jgi:hypothetical protein
MLNLIQQNAAGNYALDVSSATTTDLTDAIQQVATYRASLGASQSRLALAASTF